MHKQVRKEVIWNLRITVGNFKARADKCTIDKNGSHLLELLLGFKVSLVFLGWEIFDTTQQALDQRRTRVDLEVLRFQSIFMDYTTLLRLTF